MSWKYQWAITKSPKLVQQCNPQKVVHGIWQTDSEI